MKTAVPRKVAVVGGGITGACVCSTLAASGGVHVDLFDQGQSGIGGRTSHRISGSEQLLRWDHGCQFFRADTERFQATVQEWQTLGIATEWKGTFLGDGDFFGLPSQPPFFTGICGMKSIGKALVSGNDSISVMEGIRVQHVEQLEDKKWKLVGTGGRAAFHDTPEQEAREKHEPRILGTTYDAVVLTDVSSSFEAWHRASAGVPPDFAQKVRNKAGARVPLFSCMLAFEQELDLDLSAASFQDHDTIWFVARSKGKPGLSDLSHDCWTIVSTPEYAMRKIEETPMQDPVTGEFIPQSKDYLTTVPGPELESAFREMLEKNTIGPFIGPVPATIHLSAQRWGSALPAHRHVARDETSSTRKTLSGVAYDSSRAPLAPTTMVLSDRNFVADDERMIFQAGDMVSCYTPGFEGAALSGMDVANHIVDIFAAQEEAG